MLPKAHSALLVSHRLSVIGDGAWVGVVYGAGLGERRHHHHRGELAAGQPARGRTGSPSRGRRRSARCRRPGCGRGRRAADGVGTRDGADHAPGARAPAASARPAPARRRVVPRAQRATFNRHGARHLRGPVSAPPGSDGTAHHAAEGRSTRTVADGAGSAPSDRRQRPAAESSGTRSASRSAIAGSVDHDDHVARLRPARASRRAWWSPAATTWRPRGRPRLRRRRRPSATVTHGLATGAGAVVGDAAVDDERLRARLGVAVAGDVDDAGVAGGPDPEQLHVSDGRRRRPGP